MKKKVLYGVIMTVLASTSMGTLQSCKDDLSDLTHQVNYDRDQLRADLAATKAELIAQLDLTNRAIQALSSRVDGKLDKATFDVLLSQLEDLLNNKTAILNGLNRISNLETRVAALENNFNAVQQDLREIRVDILALQNAINTLAATDQRLSEAITALENKLGETDGKLGALADEFQALSDKFEQHLLDFDAYKEEVQSQFEEVYVALEQNQVIMTQLYNLINGYYDELNDRIDTEIAGVNAQIATINSNLVDIWEALDTQKEWTLQLMSQVNALKDELDERMDAVNAELAAQGLDIENLYMNIDRLNYIDNKIIADMIKTNDRIDEFMGYAQKQVTGIIIQGTYNPIFGDFSLPIGVQSNMLFNWYGQYTGIDAFNFPTAAGEYTYNALAPEVTPQEIAKAMRELGIPYETLQPNQLLMNGGFGTLYATVNPVNVDFDKTAFTLETSAGKKLPFGVVVTPCDEEMSFGYSRENRSEENGFYKAEISLDDVEQSDLAAAIEATRYEISDEMKAAAKKLVQDRSARDAVSLLKTMYNSLNGFLPAYAMRYDWTSMLNGEPVSNAVLSKYELAVATAKPLSYAFAEGAGIGHRLPHVGQLSNLFSELLGDTGKYHFTLGTSGISVGNITIKPITITFTPVSGSVDNVYVEIPEIKIVIDGVEHTSLPTDPVEVDLSSVNDMIGDINDSLEKSIASIQDQVNINIIDYVNSEINGMLNDLQDQINTMLSDMEGSINDQIDNILNDLINKLDNNKFMTAINKVIDIYNKVAGQFNNVLANPNHYLQPVFFYEGARRPHVLSTSVYDPTPFKKNGGDAFTIYASSYSAELVAPAYKKFIACTGVYDANGEKVTNARRDFAAEVNKDNAGKCFGILPGGYKRIVVDASSMLPEYTYEITYQGLDYSGKTSTQKFYVKVKE